MMMRNRPATTGQKTIRGGALPGHSQLGVMPSLCVAIGALLLVVQPAWCQDESALDTGTASRITGLELHRIEEGVELWIESTSDLELVGMEVNPSNQIVIQLPRHRPPSHLLEGAFEGGLISEGTVSVRETGRGPLTKVTLTVAPGSKHSLSVEANVLRFQIHPSDYHSTASSDVVHFESAITELKTDLQSSVSRQKVIEKDLADTLADNQTLENEQRALRISVATALADNRALQQRFDDLESRRLSLEAGLSAALFEFSNLEQSIASDQESSSAAEDLKSERETGLHKEVSDLKSALSDYASARYVIATQLELVTAERDALRSQVTRLEAMSDEVTLLPDESITTTPVFEQEVMLVPIETITTSPGFESEEMTPPADTPQSSASTTRATNLRATASESAIPLALLASEIEVEVLELADEWVQVMWEDQVGWLPRLDLRIVEE